MQVVVTTLFLTHFKSTGDQGTMTSRKDALWEFQPKVDRVSILLVDIQHLVKL